MTEAKQDPLADMPWRDLAIGVIPIVTITYLVPFAVGWLYDGTTRFPFFPTIIGTVRIAGDHHWADPAAAYPVGLRTHMPAAAGWWLSAAWLAVTAAIAALAAWRNIEPAIARPRLGRRDYDPRGAHPRSWARARDMREHTVTGTATDRFSLGRVDGRRIASDPEAHIVVIAPTRSGKTTRCVIPWLLEHTGPAIVTSTKTDILETTRNYRAQLGHIHVYDPFGSHCARWTPLDGCGNWSHALRQAQWLADAAQEGDSAEARFWNGEAAKLLAPLLHAAALAEGDMSDVLGWVDTKHHTGPTEILKRCSAEPARRQLLAVATLDDRNAGNTYMTAGSLLKAYRHPETHAADGPRLSADAFLDGGAHTLFIVAPDHQQRLLAPLVVAILGSILHTAADRAKIQGPLKPTLRVLLDEAANIAPLGELPRHLSQASAHGVRIATIWQSLAQMRGQYSFGADAILANSAAKLFMGPVGDDATRDYIAGLLGDELVASSSATLDPNTGQATSRTVDEDARPVAHAAALQQLGSGRAILVNADAMPAVVRLDPWWEQRAHRKRAGSSELAASRAHGSRPSPADA